jgi:hypothetical protein
VCRTVICQYGFSFVCFGSKFTGVRRLLLHPAVNYEYFILCPCILGISQLGYYFLCRFLMVYSNLQVFRSNDFLYLSEIFLNRPPLRVSWPMARARDMTTSLRRNSKVYVWLRTAHKWGLAIIVPRKQMYETRFGYSGQKDPIGMVTTNHEIKFPYDGYNNKWLSGYRTCWFVCVF